MVYFSEYVVFFFHLVAKKVFEAFVYMTPEVSEGLIALLIFFNKIFDFFNSEVI